MFLTLARRIGVASFVLAGSVAATVGGATPAAADPTPPPTIVVPSFIGGPSSPGYSEFATVTGTCVTGYTVSVVASSGGYNFVDIDTCVNGTYSTQLGMNGFADGEVTFSAVQTPPGGVASASATATSQLDRQAPTLTDGSVDIAPTVIDAANQASVTYAGVCDPENTVQLVVDDDAGAHVELVAALDCPAGGTYSGAFDASAYSAGSLTLTAVQTDPALNHGASNDDTATKTVGPLTPNPTLIVPAMIGGPSTPVPSYNVPVHGTCVTGYTVNVAAVGIFSNTELASTTCAAGLWSVAMDLTGLGQGTISFSATQTPLGGVPSEAATATSQLDDVEPGPNQGSINIGPSSVDRYNNTAVPYNGTCQPENVVHLFLLDDSQVDELAAAMDCPDSGVYSGTFDARSLGASIFTLNAEQIDPFGNRGTWNTDSAFNDPRPFTPNPTIVVPHAIGGSASPVPSNAVPLSGTCVPGNTGYTLEVFATQGGEYDLAENVPCVDGQWSISADVSAVPDGIIEFTVVQFAPPGNNLASDLIDSDPVTKDTVAPTAAEGSVAITPAIINNANMNAVPYSGTCVAGNTVVLVATDTHGHSVAVNTVTCPGAGNYASAFAASGLNDGDTITLSATQTDAAGNAGPADTDTAVKDAATPAAPSALVASPNPIITASQAGALNVSGACDSGTTVHISVDDSANPSLPVTADTACVNGAFSVTLNVTPLANGTLTTRATQSDAAGNTSDAATVTSSKDVASGTTAATVLLSTSHILYSYFGGPVRFTAVVLPALRRGPTPTGTVTFKEGNVTLGTVTIARGVAVLNFAGLSVGAHVITAEYNGSDIYRPATSSRVIQWVRAGTTATRLTASSASTTVGQPVTFTAVTRVAAGGGTPTGTVTFKIGTMTIGTASLTNGTAALTTSSLAKGTHNVTAFYSGSANYSPSTSGRVTHIVR